MNSYQLWQMRNQLVQNMTNAATDGNSEEALRIEGEIRQLDQRIADAVRQEDEARTAAPQNIITPGAATFAEQLFGARAEFSGIESGFKATAPVRDAVSGLPTPQIYKTDLKAPVLAPTGFLGTLLKGTTDGDEHFFQTPVLTNAAAGWTSGDKPESSLAWTDATAHLETVAHWIPIKKQTARRYSQLDSLVSTSLMMGLDLKCDEYALRGTNSNGIVGICNTTGILTHAKVSGKNLRDTFMTMRRKVRVASGMPAGYVCLSPYALESLYQEKDDNGRYLYDEMEVSGTIRGLIPVEDVNMTTTGESAKETALVYYNGGASWDIADPQEVTVGLTNSQFIQNEYTLLAELTAALRVETPGAFCYCSDLGLTVE